MKANDISELALFAGDLWHKRHSEILSVFDDNEKDGLNRTLAAYIRTSPRDAGVEAAVQNSANSENLDRDVIEAFCSHFSRAFITLWDRGALSRLLLTDEIPALAQQQMDQIAREASRGITPTPRVAVPVEEEDAPVEVNFESQCITDFHSLSSDTFKRKWLHDTRRRPVYDSVVAKNLV